MSKPLRTQVVITRLRASKIALFVALYSFVVSVPALLFTAGAGWLSETFPTFWWSIPTSTVH